MRWRLLRLDWRYAVGELLIVVAGVLIAFAVEGWNSKRLDRQQEVELLDRFTADLNIDLEQINFGLARISSKRALLLRINSQLESSGERPEDVPQFLSDVAAGASFGWSQPRARRTTFDEVLSSGAFGLVRSTPIRIMISDYYEWDNGTGDRIEERETQYSNLSYVLVPRSTEFELAQGLTKAQMSRIVDRIYASDLPDSVTAELNFTQFLNAQFEQWKGHCQSLIEELQTYRATISRE